MEKCTDCNKCVKCTNCKDTIKEEDIRLTEGSNTFCSLDCHYNYRDRMGDIREAA